MIVVRYFTGVVVTYMSGEMFRKCGDGTVEILNGDGNVLGVVQASAGACIDDGGKNVSMLVPGKGRYGVNGL